VTEAANTKNNRTLSWESRLALIMPGPPIIGIVIIASCLFILYLGSVWIFDLTAHATISIIALLIAYFLMIPRYLNYRDLVDRQAFGIEVLTSNDRELEVMSLRVNHEDLRNSRWSGALGILIAFIVNEVAAKLEGADLIEMFTRIHDGTVILPLTLSLGWVVGRFIFFSRTSNSEIPLPESAAIDLLHLDSLYAVGRTGLRRAFVGLVGVGILGLLSLNTVFGLWVTLPIFAIGLVTGLVILLRPARRVRNLIREVKCQELARLGPLLRQARDEALTGELPTQGRLTDLMAYRDSIESTAEWPFNSPTIIRFGLYLLIPIVSMIGGALVEQIVAGWFV
jgi:hypothetical protein